MDRKLIQITLVLCSAMCVPLLRKQWSKIWNDSLRKSFNLIELRTLFGMVASQIKPEGNSVRELKFVKIILGYVGNDLSKLQSDSIMQFERPFIQADLWNQFNLPFSSGLIMRRSIENRTMKFLSVRFLEEFSIYNESKQYAYGNDFPICFSKMPNILRL